MQSSQVKKTCALIAYKIVTQRAPHLAPDFQDLFDAVYEVAPTAEPVDKPPVHADLGQEALDPETVRELTLMGMIVIPTYHIVVGILGSAARDTVGYSVDRLQLRERLRKKRAELILRWPSCETWIDIAVHFTEAVLDELQKPKGAGHDST